MPARTSVLGRPARRPLTGLLTAAALVAAGSAATMVDATAQTDEATGEGSARSVTVTPADRVELTTVDAALPDELATALSARFEMAVTPPPPPAPEPETAASDTTSEASDVAGDGVWDRLAQCESGGNWSINTGNGFYGGLQFTLDSWRWVGGTGYPDEASRETQIAMTERLLARQGWEAWPACSRQLGLR